VVLELSDVRHREIENRGYRYPCLNLRILTNKTMGNQLGRLDLGPGPDSKKGCTAKEGKFANEPKSRPKAQRSLGQVRKGELLFHTALSLAVENNLAGQLQARPSDERGLQRPQPQRTGSDAQLDVSQTGPASSGRIYQNAQASG